MANSLISYEEFPQYWDPNRLKRLFKVMSIGGIIGIGVGIIFDDRRVIGGSVASVGASAIGQIILNLFGY